MKLSFRELQKLCVVNRALLPPNTLCGGKGATYDALEAILRTAGVLIYSGPPVVPPADTEPTSVAPAADNKTTNATVVTADDTIEETTVCTSQLCDTENLHPPMVEYEASRVIISDFSKHTIELTKLGEGGFGQVTKVQYTKGGIYAMKTLKGSQKRRFYSFLVESAHLLRLSHPNIVDVVGIEAGVDKSYILFNLYDTDLSKVLKDKKMLTDEKRLRYTYDIIAGLGYIHSRDVIHLDLKTDNVLYDGKSDRLVIADFGLSESLFCGSGSVNTRGEVGTAWYRAPEIFFFENIDNPTHDTSVDVWSVGLMILEFAGIGPLIRPYNREEFIMKAQAYLGPIDQALYSKVEEIKTKRPRYRPKVLTHYKKALNNDTLFDLALSMLAYDPKERPSMYEALKNPVFDTVRDIRHLRKTEFPIQFPI